MINHSPAQLIAEIRRLMDMDYEWLPGARHVLEEAIAVIQPLAEKSAGVEMIDPLRALIAQWRKEAADQDANAKKFEGHDGDVAARYLESCADELDALLSAPVGSPPPPLVAYMTAATTPERDAAFLRMYAARVLDRTASSWEIPNTVATTLQDIANRIERASAPRGGGETR
jgi:hypothetical protein